MISNNHYNTEFKLYCTLHYYYFISYEMHIMCTYIFIKYYIIRTGKRINIQLVILMNAWFAPRKSQSHLENTAKRYYCFWTYSYNNNSNVKTLLCCAGFSIDILNNVYRVLGYIMYILCPLGRKIVQPSLLIHHVSPPTRDRDTIIFETLYSVPIQRRQRISVFPFSISVSYIL